MYNRTELSCLWDDIICFHPSTPRSQHLLTWCGWVLVNLALLPSRLFLDVISLPGGCFCAARSVVLYSSCIAQRRVTSIISLSSFPSCGVGKMTRLSNSNKYSSSNKYTNVNKHGCGYCIPLMQPV